MAKTDEDITEQPTFNGLARQAMVVGIPLPALAVCGFAGLITTLLTMPILHGSALFFLLLPVPVLAFLHTICANDDQAIRVIMTEIRWFLRKRNTKLFNGTTTIMATKYGRQLNDYQRFFEQGIKESTSRFRLSAENLPTCHSK